MRPGRCASVLTCSCKDEVRLLDQLAGQLPRPEALPATSHCSKLCSAPRIHRTVDQSASAGATHLNAPTTDGGAKASLDVGRAADVARADHKNSPGPHGTLLCYGSAIPDARAARFAFCDEVRASTIQGTSRHVRGQGDPCPTQRHRQPWDLSNQ